MQLFPSISGRISLGLMLLVLCVGCEVKQSQRKVRVTIESSPEQGAIVMLDGEIKGETPLSLHRVSPGHIEILLKKEKYHNTLEMITLLPGEPQHFLIDMKPLEGLVSFQSTPDNTEVILDGEYSLGHTPLYKIPIMIGEHSYELRHENYFPLTAEILIERGHVYERKHTLKPIEAELSISSRPTGANVYINGMVQDKKTPSRLRLQPGTYLVAVHTTGYVEKEIRVELAPNTGEKVVLTMIPGNVPAGMVLVPAGPFICGEDNRSPDEAPRHKVELPDFYIDKYEVTNEQFKKVFPEHVFVKGFEQYPVMGVSWYQANEYAEKVGKRLPHEIEWEKAARGSDGREYPWGNLFSKTYANTKETNRSGPLIPGKHLSGTSIYGCHDMSGNVYEWTYGWYEAYKGNKLVTKEYGQIYRTLRGGSYMTDSFEARCAKRHFDRMDAKRADYGFRCALSAE